MAATTLLSDNGVTSGITGYQLTGGNDGTLQLQTTTAGGTATTAVTINNSQNVGIGTASPSQKLRVAGVSGTAQFGAGTSGNAVFVNAFDSSTIYMTASATDSTAFGFGAASNIPLFFMTNNNERMRIDSSGNVGIGTSSPANKVQISYAASSTDSTNALASGLKLSNTSVAGSGEKWGVGFSSYSGGTEYLGAFVQAYGDYASNFNTSLIFGTRGTSGSATERMRIDSSGNFLVGTTANAPTAHKMFLKTTGTGPLLAIQSTGSDYSNMLTFYNASGTTRGSIGSTPTATSYNTSSDYRLKENVQAMTGALAKVAALKPVTYTWKADGSDGEGFIAHELAEVCPHAVTGEKDAVNEDGSIKPQGIDTSFLVATLTAAIQEQQALITTLTERITALEAK